MVFSPPPLFSLICVSMFIVFIVTDLGSAIGVQTSLVLLALQKKWFLVVLGVYKITLGALRRKKFSFKKSL